MFCLLLVAILSGVAVAQPSSGCDAVNIVSRAEWGAREPVSTTPLAQVNMQFVHHTVGSRCYTQEDCMAEVRGIQNYHMDNNGWNDIGYNFLIGDDGNAYEGRGWYTLGAHAQSYNDDAIGIILSYASPPIPNPIGPPSSGCSAINIVSRSEWGARPPKGTTPLSPVNMQFIHHTAGIRCYNQADCMAEVRATQDFHMDVNGWNDIGYNFLVGDDGNAYEGRGWYIQGAHAQSYNNDAIGIVIMGDFTNVMPGQAALDALNNLLGCGAENNVNYPYTIHGHRDGCATECPGNTLYPYIQTLPGYGGTLPPC
ncbi:hypothetical protein LSH36_350g02015 [Paralvinella palmiformis]|uniref:Uncharacterized protein n=1 Tax=Paralvinella palmiformis TaxID=53620 RepID=A0AAD9JGL5_9ANNE|nr:hypothetical protein LSH36_350g02015 [Paralvinella palmiformis]